MRLRNALFTYFIPSRLISRLFDGFIAASLSGGVGGAARASLSAAAAAAAAKGERRVLGGGRAGGYRVPGL